MFTASTRSCHSSFERVYRPRGPTAVCRCRSRVNNRSRVASGRTVHEPLMALRKVQEALAKSPGCARTGPKRWRINDHRFSDQWTLINCEIRDEWCEQRQKRERPTPDVENQSRRISIATLVFNREWTKFIKRAKVNGCY